MNPKSFSMAFFLLSCLMLYLVLTVHLRSVSISNSNSVITKLLNRNKTITDVCNLGYFVFTENYTSGLYPDVYLEYNCLDPEYKQVYKFKLINNNG